MEFTLFEIHVDDVAFTVSGGTEAAESTDRDPESGPVAASEGDEASDGLPRAVLALVPVFVVLGVAAGFLAARRLGADESGAPDGAVDIGTEPRLP